MLRKLMYMLVVFCTLQVWNSINADNPLVQGNSCSQGKNATVNALDNRMQCIVLIASYTATGNQQELKAALKEAPKAGLKINEILEIFVQVYSYRDIVINDAVTTFIGILDERIGSYYYAEGCLDLPDIIDQLDIIDQSNIPPNVKFFLDLASLIRSYDSSRQQYLVLHGRNSSSWESKPQYLKDQECKAATIAIFSSLKSSIDTTKSPQLSFYIKAGKNAGLTDAQIKELLRLSRLQPPFRTALTFVQDYIPVCL